MQRVKVIKILPKQQGVTERGSWQSQEIIVEATDDVQYPDCYLLHFSGASVDQLVGLTEGMVINASWSANVRQYMSRDGREMYRQELKCWRIERG